MFRWLKPPLLALIASLAFLGVVASDAAAQARPKQATTNPIIWSNTNGGIRPFLQVNPHFAREYARESVMTDIEESSLKNVVTGLFNLDNWLGLYVDAPVFKPISQYGDDLAVLAAYDMRGMDSTYIALAERAGVEYADTVYALRSKLGKDADDVIKERFFKIPLEVEWRLKMSQLLSIPVVFRLPFDPFVTAFKAKPLIPASTSSVAFNPNALTPAEGVYLDTRYNEAYGRVYNEVQYNPLATEVNRPSAAPAYVGAIARTPAARE
jgi:hypothetical protein